METGGYAACMHTFFLAILGQIRDIRVSMESGEHAGHICAYYVAQTNNLACMHAIFLHGQTHLSVQLSPIREIMVSGDMMDMSEHTQYDPGT